MSDAGYSMLGAGAWGWPREMLWGGRWEGGSCLGTHVRIKDFKILKIKKRKKKEEKQKQMNQLLASGSQSIGVSASASVLPMNTQDLFPLGWTGWISLQSKGLSSLLQNHSSKASILQHSAFFIVQLSQPYMTTAKTIALTRWTFVGKIMSLLFKKIFLKFKFFILIGG